MRRWRAATSDGPQADPVLDHPNPNGVWLEVDAVPVLLAPDPGGVAPHAGSVETLVQPIAAVQHSPLTNWNQGSPYPGPPATVQVYVDTDSQRWWGKTGQGRLVWSERTEWDAPLPPLIPQDMLQHIDNWSGFMGGYPSIARNRPVAFGDQVPTLNPSYLPEG